MAAPQFASLQRLRQNSRPGYAWKTELAATLSLDGAQVGGRASLKTVILGQFVVVSSAKLWLL